MSHDLSLFLEGGGSRKDHLVTLRLGGGGVKGKSDSVTLFTVFLGGTASLDPAKLSTHKGYSYCSFSNWDKFARSVS